MPRFMTPMVNLYARDLAATKAFYEGFGFAETFRTPAEGPPEHVELALDGFTLGIATLEAAARDHGLAPEGPGRWIEVIVWTDDVDGAAAWLAARGVPLVSQPYDFLGGRLRVVWTEDPEGNPVQLVEKRGRVASG